MFSLGFVSALCVLFAINAPLVFMWSMASGLFLWLAPLIFVAWLRVCTRFVEQIMLPIWRSFGLMK